MVVDGAGPLVNFFDGRSPVWVPVSTFIPQNFGFFGILEGKRSPFLVKLGPWDPKVTAGCQPFLSMKKVDKGGGLP